MLSQSWILADVMFANDEKKSVCREDAEDGVTFAPARSANRDMIVTTSRGVVVAPPTNRCAESSIVVLVQRSSCSCHRLGARFCGSGTLMSAKALTVQ